MLQPDTIPGSEPAINVGIILPEDHYTKLNFIVPESDAYRLRLDGQDFPFNGSSIEYNLVSDGLMLTSGEREYPAKQHIEIYSQSKETALKPAEGILAKDIIAGRGFHWKKFIDIRLPGHLRIVRYQSSLVLINILPLEQYVMCVATSEMGAACPAALIEAQTITARSWILANVEQKHRHLGMDVCNDDCCQRYQGSTFLSPQSVLGALNTSGQVLLYNNTICDARYSKSCGGMMEEFETIWEGLGHDYLRAIPDAENSLEEWQNRLHNESDFKKWADAVPESFCSSLMVPEENLTRYLGSVDEKGKYFRWQVHQTQEQLRQVINENLDIGAEHISDIIPLNRGGSGRLNKLEIIYKTPGGKKSTCVISKEFDIRKSLHTKFLYSSAFYVEKEPPSADVPDAFVFHGCGWGHGVGLCQIGALGMALDGYKADKIVQHYYPGSVLKALY